MPRLREEARAISEMAGNIVTAWRKSRGAGWEVRCFSWGFGQAPTESTAEIGSNLMLYVFYDEYPNSNIITYGEYIRERLEVALICEMWKQAYTPEARSL